jgi:hypothetical protein
MHDSGVFGLDSGVDSGFDSEISRFHRKTTPESFDGDSGVV